VRHGKKTAKLGRDHSHRKAMMNNMVASLLAHEHVSTTSARGKELKRQAEHMITFAKRGDLHARRQVLRSIADKSVVSKLFDELGPRYSERNGGYTRLIKVGPRRGDGAEMCIVELVDRPGEEAAVAPTPKEERAEETVASDA
jgi:large subunit ribosomal protein L17